MIATRLLKISVKCIGLIVLLVAVAQLCAFPYFSGRNKTLNKADVIVAFSGDDNRISAACSLAQQNYAANLAATGLTREKLAKEAAELVNFNLINLVDGGRSRSTFEDVYRTKEILEKKNYKAIVLVTSSYHMPRALLLLKVYLVFSGLKVDIQYFAVRDQANKPTDLRPFYNEMIKIWGSLVEMFGYKICHELLNDKPSFKKARAVIHNRFLFKG